MNRMIDVAAAVIVDEKDRIFIARKRKGLPLEGMWEFPGGKIEQGETAAEAIERELMEEMGVRVEPEGLLGENVHHYDEFSVRLIAHYARIVEGQIKLSDHDMCEWVSMDDLNDYVMEPADEPLKQIIQNRNGSAK